MTFRETSIKMSYKKPLDFNKGQYLYKRQIVKKRCN